MPRLLKTLRRRHSRGDLRGTTHARDFLTNVGSNAGLLAAAQGYGIVPAQLADILAR